MLPEPAAFRLSGRDEKRKSFLGAEAEMIGKKRNGRAEMLPSLCFMKTGKENTKLTLEAARLRAQELGVKHIVVATASGATGLAAARMFKGLNVVAVTHSTGFLKPGYQELKPGLRRKLEAAGAKVLTCQHSFGGVVHDRRFSMGSGVARPRGRGRVGLQEGMGRNPQT